MYGPQFFSTLLTRLLAKNEIVHKNKILSPLANSHKKKIAQMNCQAFILRKYKNKFYFVSKKSLFYMFPSEESL